MSGNPDQSNDGAAFAGGLMAGGVSGAAATWFVMDQKKKKKNERSNDNRHLMYAEMPLDPVQEAKQRKLEETEARLSKSLEVLSRPPGSPSRGRFTEAVEQRRCEQEDSSVSINVTACDTSESHHFELPSYDVAPRRERAGKGIRLAAGETIKFWAPDRAFIDVNLDGKLYERHMECTDELKFTARRKTWLSTNALRKTCKAAGYHVEEHRLDNGWLLKFVWDK